MTPKEKARQNIEVFLKSIDAKRPKAVYGVPASAVPGRQQRIDREIRDRVGDIFPRNMAALPSGRYLSVVRCVEHPEWGEETIYAMAGRIGVSRDRIVAAMQKGQSAGGCRFVMADGTDFPRASHRGGWRIGVVSRDDDGNVVGEWESVHAAARHFKCAKSSVMRACNGRRLVAGFRLGFKNELFRCAASYVKS